MYSIESMGLKFFIGPEVFTPKPSMSMIIRIADREIKKKAGNIKVADFGSGTGFISILLKHHNPNIEIHAYEKYPEAFAYLNKNVKYHNLDIYTHLSDVRDISDTGFDVVISNPPYLPNSVKPEMIGFPDQPEQAYCGGEYGYELPKQFITKAAHILKPNGYLLSSHITSHNKVIQEHYEKYFYNIETVRCDRLNLPDDLCTSFTYAYRAL